MIGDGVDPVEDELMDKRMAVHNLHMAVDKRDAEIKKLKAQLAAAERERDELRASKEYADAEVAAALAEVRREILTHLERHGLKPDEQGHPVAQLVGTMLGRLDGQKQAAEAALERARDLLDRALPYAKYMSPALGREIEESAAALSSPPAEKGDGK